MTVTKATKIILNIDMHYNSDRRIKLTIHTAQQIEWTIEKKNQQKE